MPQLQQPLDPQLHPPLDLRAHPLKPEQAVVEQLESLPELDRAIIVARFFDGLDATAIGRAYNLPPSTVRSRLRRALLRLRGNLDERFDGDRATWAIALGVALPDRTGGVATASTLSAPKLAGLVAVIVGVGTAWLVTRPGPGRSNSPTPTPTRQDNPDERPPSRSDKPAEPQTQWRRRRAAIEKSMRVVREADAPSPPPVAPSTNNTEQREQLISEALAA